MEWEGKWFKNSLVGWGTQGGSVGGSGEQWWRSLDEGELMGWGVGRWLLDPVQIWVSCGSSIRL